MVYDDLHYGDGKRKSAALLVKDLKFDDFTISKLKNAAILKLIKVRIKILPRQIYSKLRKVPFKHLSSKKNVIEFRTQSYKFESCDKDNNISLNHGQ